ncbi:MAG: DUF1566 domain-containing protein [Prevotella sp.]|nr:DUF1566 domain-containing protein [Prevotella sp.]
MKTISRYIMTLALLLTAATGAWATDDLIIKEITVPSEWNDDNAYLTVDEMTGFKDFSSLTDDEARALLNSVPTGKVLIFYGAGASSNSFKLVQNNGTKVYVGEMPFTHKDLFGEKDNYKYYYTASDAIKVTPGSSANTWTFSMPGSDVVLTPIYAKAAAFATTGTETEAKTQLPEAAEGVIAGTDAPLIAEGTGIVAFAGESTEVTQGTLMYAIGNSATEAPAPDAFSATVPTAKNVADGGADVYVWYYIQGADAPQGEAATLDNTFDDTEPACLTVQVLSNKFDIQFNAANANTIEAGKATVTVDDQPATVTDGKLQGVKMGSEVKLEANPGYKFRKVEVKKKAPAPSLSITNPVVGQVIGSDGKNYAYASLPEGVTAVAKICYVSGSNGLALALTDEGAMNWSTAIETCAAHTPAFTGGTWKLATKAEWSYMINAAGSYSALRDGFSSVGGTNMQSDVYFSSTEYDSFYAWLYYFNNGFWDFDSKNYSLCVRACLAF